MDTRRHPPPRAAILPPGRDDPLTSSAVALPFRGQEAPVELPQAHAGVGRGACFRGPGFDRVAARPAGYRLNKGAWRSGWRARWLVAGLLYCLVITPALAESFKGRVVKVIDGDTVVVLGPAKRTERVRIQGIDAPEADQPFGAQARQRLQDLVGGKVVTVVSDKRDRHGRLLGKLMHGGQDMGLALIREGFAWWYRDYATDQILLDRVLYPLAEVQARWDDSGLWADPDPIPPWVFRHR
mgnify:FL=1